MKRILLPAALLVAFAGSAAFAQQTTTPPSPAPLQSDGTQAPAPVVRPHKEKSPHKEAMKMAKELNLTPDQSAKVEPILADRQQKLDALEANTALTDQDRKKQAHKIGKESDDQLATVLTPDQVQQMKAAHHGHHPAPPAPPADSTATPPPTT